MVALFTTLTNRFDNFVNINDKKIEITTQY